MVRVVLHWQPTLLDELNLRQGAHVPNHGPVNQILDRALVMRSTN